MENALYQELQQKIAAQAIDMQDLAMRVAMTENAVTTERIASAGSLEVLRQTIQSLEARLLHFQSQQP